MQPLVLTSCVCGVSRLWPLGFQQVKWGTLWSWTHQRGAAGSKIPLWHTGSAPHIIPLTPGQLTWETGEAVYACQAFTSFWAHAHAYMDMHAHAVIMFLPFSHHAMVNWAQWFTVTKIHHIIVLLTLLWPSFITEHSLHVKSVATSLLATKRTTNII